MHQKSVFSFYTEPTKDIVLSPTGLKWGTVPGKQSCLEALYSHICALVVGWGPGSQNLQTKLAVGTLLSSPQLR